jgi:outer membrane protein assembly factor BamB
MDGNRTIPLVSPRRTILKAIGFAGLTSLGSSVAAAQAPEREVWMFDVGDIVVSSPTVVENTLYVGSNGSDVYSIDKSTGEKKWIFETGGFVNSSPTIVDNTLYVGSNDNNVYAINKNTGEKQWEFDTGDKIRSSPAFADGKVFIGNGDFQDPVDTSIYAINADTGQQEWRYETGDRISSVPIINKGTVYVTSTDGEIYALDTEEGSLNWSKNIGAGRGSPTIVDETVYVPGFNGIFALDKKTGSEQWKYEEEISFISSSPTVANGVLYVGLTSGNKLTAIDIDSGNEIWEFTTENAIYSSPTYADETIFIGNEGGNVFSIDANTGNEKWRFSAGDEVGSSPIVVDGTLYIGSTKRDPYGGSVYAIDTDISGSSEGSRAKFKTLGHHDVELGGDEPSLFDLTIDAPSEAVAGNDVTIGVDAQAVDSQISAFQINPEEQTDHVNDFNDLSVTTTAETQIEEPGFVVYNELQDQVTVEWTGTIPENAEAGETFTLAGDTLNEAQDRQLFSHTMTVTDDPLAEYRNENGEVDDTGLLEAISDWRDDDLEDTQLLQLISEWREAGGNVKALPTGSLPNVK